MIYKDSVTIVIPTLNELDNIEPLCRRIHKSLSAADVPYEILFIDDHSIDGTYDRIVKLSSSYNIRVKLKSGKSGKAYSLIEGFAEANSQIICMIDADLQYPPEAIASMYELLLEKKADIVISEREHKATSFIRNLSSKTFNYIFAKALFGIGYDTQSGLKIFNKRVLRDFELTPSPWSFDLEFIVRSLENERKIISYPIPFSERENGVTKVKLLSTTLELAKASVALRFKTSFRKTNAGLKSNDRFLERAFKVVGALLIAGVFATARSTNAQVSPADIENILAPLTSQADPVVQETLPEIIENAESYITPQSSTAETVQNTEEQIPVMATNANPQTSREVIVEEVSELAVFNSSVTTSSQRSTSNQTSINEMSPQPESLQVVSFSQNLNNETSAVPESLQVVSDTSKLSAATAEKPFSDYANGYPDARKNAGTRDLLKNVSRYALYSSAIVAALFGIRRLGRYKNFKLPVAEKSTGV